MKRFLIPLLSVTALVIASCTSVNNQASKLNPVVVGNQTTVLVQGVEIALQRSPAHLNEFKTAAHLAGNYLIQISLGAVVFPTTVLQEGLEKFLLSKGILPVNATAVSKIAIAEYETIAVQFGFANGVPVPGSANVPAVNALLAEIGNALIDA